MVSPNTLRITNYKMPPYEGEIHLAGSTRAAARREQRAETKRIKTLLGDGMDYEFLLNHDTAVVYANRPAPVIGPGRALVRSRVKAHKLHLRQLRRKVGLIK